MNYSAWLSARNTLRFWLMAVLVSIMSLSAPLWAQQEIPSLLTPSLIEKDVALQDPTITRSHFVYANLSVLTAFMANDEFEADQPQSMKIALNLFRDVALVAEIDYFEKISTTSVAYVGHIVGYEDNSELILINKDNTLIGNISLANDFYQIRSAGTDISVVHQIDQSQFPPEEHVPAVLPEAAFDTIASASADDGSTIDVLVVYTAAAQASTNNIQALIDLAVTETNTGYFNSKVNQRLNLVHAQKISYSENQFDWYSALSRLRGQNDNYMDNVHSLRDTYKADVVVLLVNNRSYCGLAYLMSTERASFESSAFAVVNVDCATGYYSFGHELGHLMGSHHDRGSAYSSGAFPYSYGYQAPDASFRTVMAYNCSSGCTRVNYWSNPNVTYKNKPTGVATNKSNSAFNAKSLNNTADTVANFRQSGQSGGFACSQVSELPQTECQALVALYDSTQGDKWNKKSGWMNTTTPCNQPWSGVTCANGHVVKLSLADNNLTGTLPTKLENLSYLTHLYLNHNNLSGKLPAELGNLTQLQQLYLYNNNLSGTVPSQLSNLTQLKGFYLHNNVLSGQIPTQLGKLENLRAFYLFGNQLEGYVPAALGNLSYLRALVIHNNDQLQGPLPSNLVNLTQLKRLYFENTQLCEPQDKAFQVWLAGIDVVRGTNVMCAN